MPYVLDTATSAGFGGLAHYDLLDRIRRFACGYGTAGAPAKTGTGTGTMTGVDTHPATVTETWTIICTSIATPGAESWSVTGSVSGVKAVATTGVAYDNGLLAFLISAGGTAWAVNDQLTVATTAGAVGAAARWTQLRYDTVSANRELILQGVGLSGTEQIFVGIKCYQDSTADYYNLAVATFTGYLAGNTFATQPGASPVLGIPAHNITIVYYLSVTGARINMGWKVGTPVYQMAQVGKFLPFALPSTYPQPLIAAGMLTSMAATRYSDTAYSTAFKGTCANLCMRFNDGVWHTPDTHPWLNAGVPSLAIAPLLRSTGTTWHLTPITLCDGTPNVYGQIDGFFQVVGFNNVVENVIQRGGSSVVDPTGLTLAQICAAITAVGGTPYIVLQDVWRTGFADLIAMEMT